MRRVLVPVLLVALAATRAEAQGSAFALRGLGWPGRPVSARTAGTAGATAMFDPEMALNPAALARWRSVAGWAVGAPTRRTFTGPAGDAEQQTVRFPLFGFASPIRARLAVGVSFSDYLDRTYTVEVRDSVVLPLRGTTERYRDAGRSVGGVSDFALGAGYRLSRSVALGAAYHYYLGSTRLAAQRAWDNNAVFEDVTLASNTDFRGMGIGAGVMVSSPRFEAAASGRLNGRLLSDNSTGSQARTPLPHEFSAGLRWEAAPGVYLNASGQWHGWSRADADLRAAGQEGAHDTWGFGAGAEVLSTRLLKVRTPLRVGYRWRQLPFTNLGAELDERAYSGGVGFNFAGERTTVDISVERGRRSAGGSDESFTSVFVGLTVRP